MHLKLEDGYQLKKGIAVVAAMASKAIFHIGDRGLSMKASKPDSNILTVLRIGCSGFITYKAVEEMYGEIDPKELEKFLEIVVDESVSIFANIHGGNILKFELESRYQELHSQPLHGKIQKSVKTVKFNKINDASQMIEDLPFDTKAIVTTRSTVLPSILLDLNSFGQLVKVSITTTQLKLSAKCVTKEEKEIVLTKEKGECTIVGVAENDLIQFSFGVELKMMLSAFSDASDLSKNVWMFTPAKPESPLMLDCPVGTEGSIKFYLPCNMIEKK